MRVVELLKSSWFLRSCSFESYVGSEDHRFVRFGPLRVTIHM